MATSTPTLLRNSLAGFGEAVVLGHVCVREAAKPARVSDDEAACEPPREMLACSSGICPRGTSFSMTGGFLFSRSSRILRG